MSTYYHPQNNGQMKIVNKCVEQYLRCVCRDKPKERMNHVVATSIEVV